MLDLHCWTRRGYTLIELVVALSLIGILASLAAPAFGDYLRRVRMQTALDALARDIFHARMVAIRSGQRVEMRFSLSDNQCVEQYRIVTVGQPERELKDVDLRESARGLCLRKNGAADVSFSSRGRPSWNFSFWIRHAEMRDSLTLNQLGRLHRWQ